MPYSRWLAPRFALSHHTAKDIQIHGINDVGIYLIAAVWLAFDLFFIMNLSGFALGRAPGSPGFFLIPFFALHLLPVWIAVLGPLYRYFAWTRVDYVLTTRRIYLQSGLIGRDYTSLELYEVSNLTVNVGVLERLQNRGTIRLVPDVTTGYGENSSTRTGARLKHIAEPYEVYNQIKRMALNVETDTRDPNAYHPGENPGYRTEYRGPRPR